MTIALFNMSNFAQRSRSYTDARLFEILREAEKYNPEAVGAARAEIERRGLKETDFPATPPPSPLGRLGDYVDGFALPRSTNRPDDVIDWIDEPGQENSTGRSYWQLLLLVASAGLLYEIYLQLDFFRFVLGPLSNGIDHVFVIMVVGIVLNVFIIFMLWRLKRIGFQLMAGLSAYSIIGVLGVFVYLIRVEGMSVSDILDFLLSFDGIGTLTGIGMSVATIFLLSRTELMALFHASQQQLIQALAIGIGLGMLSQLYFQFDF